MCDPATIASGAMSAFSAISDYSAQSAATNATNQRRAQAQQRAQAEARAAAIANMEAVAAAQHQEEDAGLREQSVASRESLGARASATASAAENGVSGISIDHMLNDFEGNKARFNNSIRATLDQSKRDDLFTVSNIQRDYQTRWANGEASYEEGPSIMGPIGGVAGSVVGGYAKWRKLNPVDPVKKTTNSFSGKSKGYDNYEG